MNTFIKDMQEYASKHYYSEDESSLSLDDIISQVIHATAKEIEKAYEAYPYKSPELDAFFQSIIHEITDTKV